MRVLISTSVDERAWEESLQRLNAPLFHSAIWARYVAAERPALRPLFCSLVDDEGTVRGAALLFDDTGRNPLMRPFRKRLYSDAHPVVEGDEPLKFLDFMQYIERHARRTGTVELTIGSFGTPGHDGELEQLGYELNKRLEFCLPLDRPHTEIWSAMERRRRRTIQKAEQLGVTVDFLPMQEGIAHLRRLQAITVERLTRRGASAEMGTSCAPEKDPVAVLINSDRGDLVGAWHNGKVVSVSLYTKMNGLAYSTLAGHAPEAYETQAYSLLLWKTIQNYQAAGLRWLNIGGVPASASDPASPDHGLYGFKVGLGCDVHPCVTASKILRPGRAKLLASVKSMLGR